MLSDMTIAAKVDGVTLDVKFDEGVTIRKAVVRFAREFDDDVAAALGGDARKALASLRSHGMEKVYMDISRVLVRAELVSALDSVTISALRGLTAVCTASKDADDGPTIRMQFECVYTDAVWGFLGRNGGGVVQVGTKAVQGVIPQVEGAAG